MHTGGFRFAVVLSLALAVTAVTVAWTYDLPVRDPDGVAVPTYVRLPLILLLAFLTDVLPRTVWRARSLTRLPRTLVAVVRERWPWDHVRFALVGLGAWYLTYASFRNLKSFVPFVNRHLWDGTLEDLDRILWLGHDPASRPARRVRHRLGGALLLLRLRRLDRVRAGLAGRRAGVVARPGRRGVVRHRHRRRLGAGRRDVLRGADARPGLRRAAGLRGAAAHRRLHAPGVDDPGPPHGALRPVHHPRRADHRRLRVAARRHHGHHVPDGRAARG